ncbi:FAD:protein FMN transferase [Novosphingobium sp. EMRT-2]|uniref:FAD:protein FMN transferase n=1 Tax=Novosphingobium sp. EMRT-2 TaxID=2571749 RepID=UPI0026A9795C
MTIAASTVPAAMRIAVPERIDETALARFDRGAPVVDCDGETMGTRWHVRMALPAGGDAELLAARVQARLDGIVAEMSHWEPSSLLSRYNRAAPGSWTALPPDFAAVMEAALQVAERSAGVFDPALGRLTDVWGLGPRRRDAPPDEAAIARALEVSGWRRLALDRPGEGVSARLLQPGGLWLDLSGVAKGYAADAVADLLARAGVAHALVGVGGECVGRGMRPDGDPWWVDLETPAGIALPALRVALHQLAVATSGDYLRGAHTLDPRTGHVPYGAASAISVLHASCMMADAWASALGAVPIAEARDLAVREGLATRLITRDGAEWLSPALSAML